MYLAVVSRYSVEYLKEQKQTNTV